MNGGQPCGYIYDRNLRRLQINPDEVPLVKLVYEEFLAGKSCKPIIRELNRRGLKPRNGVHWWPATIATILRNPVYTGYIVYGQTFDKPRDRRRPRSEWIWSEEPAHEAIIPLPTWERVQTMRERKRLGNRPTNYEDSPFLLTGLIRCWCGEKMAGNTAAYRVKSGEQRHRRFYRCYVAARGGPNHGMKHADTVEGQVLDQIAALAESSDFLERARKQVLLDRMRSSTSAAQNLDGLRAELEGVRGKQKILYRDRLDGRLGLEHWERFHANLVEQEEDLAARLDREERAILATGGRLEVAQVLDVLRDFRRVFDNLEIPQKKAVLRGMVAEVRVSESREGPPAIRWLAPWAGFADTDTAQPSGGVKRRQA